MNNTTYYFPERQYRSSQGRWLSPDPAGMSAVDPSSPQSWNRYAYVTNSPLNAVDPTGLACYFLDACNAASGWTGNWGTCDPVYDAMCVFDPRTPWYTNRQGGQGGFSFGFDVAPGFGFGDGGGAWGEWQAPLPTSPGQVYQSIWSDVLGLPTGLNCPQMGGILSPLCGGVSPLMDAEAAGNQSQRQQQTQCNSIQQSYNTAAMQNNAKWWSRFWGSVLIGGGTAGFPGAVGGAGVALLYDESRSEYETITQNATQQWNAAGCPGNLAPRFP